MVPILLQTFFKENPKVALGFSGGVDSAFLLWAALACEADVRPYYMKTAFQPEFELEDALRLGKQLGIEISVIEMDVLANKAVAQNPKNRCYHCKTALFGLLREHAIKDGYPLLLDGTNASDQVADRPGMQALQELAVRSPLRECKLTKAEIRCLSKQAGLFTWNKPAYACLATRIPTGQPITAPLLARIEAAEAALFALGFTDFRVRVLADAARIELPADGMQTALQLRKQIKTALSPYFHIQLLDLQEREPSWNNEI